MATIKREIYFIFAGIGIELVAVGVGVLISLTGGWIITGIGFLVFI